VVREECFAYCNIARRPHLEASDFAIALQRPVSSGLRVSRAAQCLVLVSSKIVLYSICCRRFALRCTNIK